MIDAKSKALQSAVVNQQTNDSFTNSLARLGFAQPNLTNGAQYPITRLTRNYSLLNSLYRDHWIVRRIIDTIAQDMVKAWINFKTELEPEEQDAIDREIRLTRVKTSLLKTIKWARLYGGAAAIMMIEGQEDRLDEPLEIDSILPGQFKGLIVLDRWSGIYPQLETVDDINSPEYGLPKYYIIKNEADTGSTNTSIRVHHTRVLRFTGDDLPLWEELAETYWGASVMESIFNELKKRDNTSANIAHLVFMANLRVLKMSDLGQLLTTVNAKAQKDLYSTLSAQNLLMSNMGVYVMDAADGFETFQYSFSGIDGVYELFMLDLSGAADIPATRLYGRSPQGMNSTGEGEENNYNGMILQKQEEKLRPVLEKLLPVIEKSALGRVTDDLEFDFNTIEKPNQKEIAEQVWRTSQAIREVYDSGIISQKIALKELKQTGKPLGIFTNITDADIEGASNELSTPLEFAGSPNEK